MLLAGRGRMASPVGSVLAAFILMLAILYLATAIASSQETRELRGVALSIGNGDYEALPKLPNPPEDADAIEALLSDLGFDSVRRTDRDAEDLQRDLDRFVEDAEDADVAVLYYAGHGIEAGGENYLVPVDADLSALDAAAERLVPLSAVLDRLRRSVPVTILLLDACRDNPFPATATLRPQPGGEAVAVSAGGLARTRGARALAETASAEAENLGMVIGFAAEPGMPALDGEVGGHSPYAAALLRHIDAMAGEEFGTVMRMVAEEVYLKTGGRQRPWTNESLRRLLYLGERPDPVEGPEGEILSERRQLLVHIAALPRPQRARAETLADAGRVPMSVVYAMMRAAGLDPADDPDKVEARLKAEIDRFAELRRERNAMENPDPEIERLTRLADEAELEGALNAANDFREQAKERVASLRSTRLDQLEALRQRFIEDAEVFARSAETKKLLFRFEEAARDYGGAREIVAEIDAERALRYRIDEIAAYLTHAELQGAGDAIGRAETLARDALETGGRMQGPVEAELRHKLALVLMLRTSREGGAALLPEARDLLERALSAANASSPATKARMLVDYARVAGHLALLSNELAALSEAEADLEEAAALARTAGDKALEAEARFRQVQSQYYRWSAAPDDALLQTLIGHLEDVIDILPEEETDLLAARYVVNATYLALDVAVRQNTPEALTAAGEINLAALNIFEADRFPLVAADLRSMGGRIALEWSERFGDGSGLLQAEEVQRATLEIFREAEAETAVRETEWRLAQTLSAIGRREPGNDRLAEAIAIFERLADTETARTSDDLMRQVDFETARANAALGWKTGDADRLRDAVQVLRRLQDTAPADVPHSALGIDIELGKALFYLGRSSGEDGNLREGTELLARSIAVNEELGARQANLGPFLELAQSYAEAAGALALETNAPSDIDNAISAHSRLHDLFAEVGHAQGLVVSANDLAYLLLTSLRSDFDERRLARAEELAKQAQDGLQALPQIAGYVQNTTCEIRTERARHERSLATARTALAECQEALATLSEGADSDVVSTATASVERAVELVEELEE